MMIPHPDDITLNDYADDALRHAERAGVDEHLASCSECRTLVEDLRKVRTAARALTALTPRPEAWSRIERALRPAPASRWSWLAAAAALVLATLIGFALVELRRQAPGAGETADAAATAVSVEAELRQAEEHYQKAIAGLEQIADAGKSALDPRTAATLAKNLMVIDEAISESRAALKAQPSNALAQASLLESLKSKIALLQDTVALINEVRLAQRGA